MEIQFRVWYLYVNINLNKILYLYMVRGMDALTIDCTIHLVIAKLKSKVRKVFSYHK